MSLVKQREKNSYFGRENNEKKRKERKGKKGVNWSKVGQGISKKGTIKKGEREI